MFILVALICVLIPSSIAYAISDNSLLINDVPVIYYCIAISYLIHWIVFIPSYLQKTEKFHQLIEDKKKSTEEKIIQMKESAIRDIKNTSVKISMEAVKHLIENSIDKNKLEKIYSKSLENTKNALQKIEP